VQAFGLGFAIPVDTARRVADQLMQDGSATKPILGVSGSLSGSDSSTSVAGAQVTGVTEGGAASRAGIARGDVITKVNGVPIGNYADLMAQVLKQQPGQTIPLTVTSGGSSRTVDVTLGTAKDTATTTVPSRQQQQSPFGGDSPFGGFPFG
jgi:putative serine protease PepD